ncbi:MAG: helix-turn-helix transcriptional regulator [Myxococcota bacterium]|nr:helix-turn-helix transcriptional regulator [Myxococcota bacterium]
MKRPKAPPEDTRVTRIEHAGEELVVFSYPIAEGPPAALVEPLAERLTPAQAEVAWRALEGRTNAEIAAARGTSARTVAKQLEQIYRRLGINSRRELAALAGERRSARRRDG